MVLNRQQLQAALEKGRKSYFLPFSLHLFQTVNSTNQILWELLNQGAKTGSVVIATQQTAGRGQWGRQWISPTGGLYLSVAVDAQLDANNSYQLTFATAWGIAKQLQNCGVSVGIKWPNDLILEQRKLGGILTETKVQQGKISQAVIGVGINWNNPVPPTGINLEMWQTGKELKPISSVEMLAAQVLLGIESGIHCLFEEGVNKLLSGYVDLLANMGDRIQLNNLPGIVVGVTHTGELHVRMETSTNKLATKQEIYLQPGTISLGYRQSSDSCPG
ncbi:MAG: biotin--[acetyl-CoA-carboxylase] ligase [Nostocaceae cyanobacterium]|nr:biotin--[acetyl-CoA-carboxylase] ligase [Nostocaceae cyanobacterium]